MDDVVFQVGSNDDIRDPSVGGDLTSGWGRFKVSSAGG